MPASVVIFGTYSFGMLTQASSFRPRPQASGLIHQGVYGEQNGARRQTVQANPWTALACRLLPPYMTASGTLIQTAKSAHVERPYGFHCRYCTNHSPVPLCEILSHVLEGCQAGVPRYGLFILPIKPYLGDRLSASPGWEGSGFKQASSRG
ncbi:hypothetical protein JB92DRAFT_2856129 [Gautieria morchelliformis]|nr:hypothetical protein JB92DRAFT_2856129 [Gautieria morchelliformis]